MLENAAQIDGRPRRVRAAVTNDPLRLRGLDARSRTGRRRADLIVQFIAASGGRDRITEGQLGDIVRAAELVALAEDARLTALKGGSEVDLVALVRLEGVADRAVRRLGIPSAAGKPVEVDLKAYLAALPKEPVGTKRTPVAPSGNHAPNGEVPAPSSSPFERARVGDRVPLDDGREIEIIPDDDEDGPAL
jgi:hypothetical protein